MKLHPPAVVEVTRGDFAESTHLVDIVVSDADGALVETWGERDISIFPRSAIKSLQALPLVESGAADEYGFEPIHLALSCASHNAQPMHVTTASEMLEKAGLSETCLECGAQLPRFPEDQAQLFREDVEVSAIHNNCSGKHAGFLAFAKHSGLPIKNYIKFDSPVQREIAGTLEAVVGAPHTKNNYAIDGCSIPTFQVPLNMLALAYAKFGVGKAEGQCRSEAMKRLRDACTAHPEMVAGDKRACTEIMRALGNRVFVKVGAEGVYTASIPELGYGIAMKARDGDFRAVEVAVSALISRFLSLNEREHASLKPQISPVLKNWNGYEVGLLRAQL